MKRVLKAGVTLLFCLSLFISQNQSIEASSDNGLYKIRCTCYIINGITASGHKTRPGIIAGKKEDIGKIAALYQIDKDGSLGEFIGYYEFLDTGSGIDTDGDGKGDSIKKGLSVDVWQPSLKDAKEWIKQYGDYVYIKIIEGEG